MTNAAAVHSEGFIVVRASRGLFIAVPESWGSCYDEEPVFSHRAANVAEAEAEWLNQVESDHPDGGVEVVSPISGRRLIFDRIDDA
jgi:hypothetical protein